MQPYEFGMRIGRQLEKRAEGERGWGGFARDVALGQGGLTGQVDPMQRGMAAHVLAYSNPFTGVPTALNDTGRHLYNGRYLSALGSVGEGALSFLPGFGFLGGTAAKGLAAGGKALAGAGMRQAGGAMINTARTANRGRLAVQGAEAAAAKGIQRAIPLAKPPVPAATGAAGWGAATRNAPANLRNYAINHPIQATAGGLGPIDPLTTGAVARGEHFMTPDGRAYQQQMQQPQMPQMPTPQMPASAPMQPPKPQTTFRPKPMLNF
jgi:hypothetical protein